MANVYATNFALQSANHAFSAIWKLTRALKKAGWSYLSSGDGTSKDTTELAANDKWGGSADPMNDTYSTALDGVAAWWNAQGPTTLKVSMTSAPTGAFIRGEKVTQATSNAEGEFLGYDFDAGQGHAVILPRTGNFDATNVITGASSGATFTPTALKTFVMEIVFWKSAANTTQGSIYLQRVCDEDENSSRFSVLATQTGCTGSVAPGGGGTNNAFPSAGSYVGCGSQTGTPAHSNWFQVNTNLGKAQIVATNCAGSAGTSPDGTFWVLIGDVTNSTQAQFFSYMRTDGGEDADLDPFVWTKLSGTAYNHANVRLDATGTVSLSGYEIFWGSAPTHVNWRGWRRRGFTTNDTFVPLTTSTLAYFYNNNTQLLMADNTSNPETVASAYSAKRVREQILICSGDNTKKVRKGYTRWMWTIMGGTTFDTWDGKTKVCILPPFSASYPPAIVGPYDGSSTPQQA